MDGRRKRARRIEDVVPTHPGTLGSYALAYMRDLEIRNYSAHTLKNLHTNLRIFLTWCDERGLLLIGDPPEMGEGVLPGNNYHVYDIPLFWKNLQEDVLARVKTWTTAAAS